MQVNCQFFSPPQLLSRLAHASLLLVFFLLPRYANAQDECNLWGIEISAQLPSNITGQLGSEPSSCIDGGPCDNIYYYVSLVRAGDENGTTVSNDFRFVSLNFSGTLVINAGGVTSRTFSLMDVAASQSCSPGDVNDPANLSSPIASWDADGNFSYSITSANSAGITWPVVGRRLLFVIAVHAYPGETVEPGGLSGSFELVTGTFPNITIKPCGVTPAVLGTLAKTLPALVNCNSSSLKLRLGAPEDVIIPGFPNAMRIPVSINGSAVSYSVQSLEFLLKITSNQPMAEISITEGILPVTAVLLYKETNNSMNQRAFFSAQNFTVPGGSTITLGNTLFYIVVRGPALNSGCAKVEASFVGPRRLQTLSSTGDLVCCQPLISGMPLFFDIGPTPCTPYCTAGVSLQVKKVGTQASNACSDLYFELKIANESANSLSYQSGLVTLDLTHNGELEYFSFSPLEVNFNPSPLSVTSTDLSPEVLRLELNFTAASSIALGPNASKTLGTFTLHGSNVCIESIYFHDAILINGTQDCVPTSVSTEVGAIEGDALCLQSFSIKFETQYPTQQAIDEVGFDVSTSTGNCTVSGLTDHTGLASLCLCNALVHTITPLKNNNPLNGVSTFDLVLISRHILGLESLNSPYRIIAADANKGGSVTSFDIVELRKLILGIYQNFPNNTSWWFVEEGFVFPDQLNPFQSAFDDPHVISLPLNNLPIRFYGIKTGDVNGSAIPNIVIDAPEDRNSTTLALGYSLPSGRRGEVLEVPLFVRQTTDIAAWQLALRYDPAQMKIKNVRWAMSAEPTPYEMADWHTPTPGELRLCWFDRSGAATHLDAQAPIAYLQVEWLGNPAKDAHAALELIGTIPGEAYSINGQIANLALAAVPSYQAPVIVAKAVQSKPEWLVSAYPNPTGGIFRFEVSLPVGGEGRIGLYDPMGRLVTRQDISFTPGLNVVTSQHFPPLSTGIYFVRFDTPMGRQTLRLVKN